MRQSVPDRSDSRLLFPEISLLRLDTLHAVPVSALVSESDFITTPDNNTMIVEYQNCSSAFAVPARLRPAGVACGSRQDEEGRWSERIWTTMATCAQQGRSAFDFISRVVQAHFSGLPPPSLLPA